MDDDKRNKFLEVVEMVEYNAKKEGMEGHPEFLAEEIIDLIEYKTDIGFERRQLAKRILQDADYPLKTKGYVRSYFLES